MSEGEYNRIAVGYVPRARGEVTFFFFLSKREEKDVDVACFLLGVLSVVVLLVSLGCVFDLQRDRTVFVRGWGYFILVFCSFLYTCERDTASSLEDGTRSVGKNGTRNKDIGGGASVRGAAWCIGRACALRNQNIFQDSVGRDFQGGGANITASRKQYRVTV